MTNHRGCSGCEEHPEPGTDQCRECLLEDERDVYRSALADLLAAAHGTTIAESAMEKARAVLRDTGRAAA